MKIVCVTLLLDVQESYGLRAKAVKKTLGPRLGAPVPLAVW